METQRIEYVRKNGRNRGPKKGVLYCGIDPHDDKSVILGFSLCHSIDTFDYVDGNRVPGFGFYLAKKRAGKWKNFSNYFVQNTYTEAQIDDAIMNDKNLYIVKNKNFVEIPPSIIDRLSTFIQRCKKYYKDKNFPDWVNNFEKGYSANLDLLEEVPINFENKHYW